MEEIVATWKISTKLILKLANPYLHTLTLNTYAGTDQDCNVKQSVCGR